MRIAFFDATPLWSGGASRILFLAQKLKASGEAEPFIICLPDSILYKKSIESGIKTIGLKPLSDIGLISFFKILNILKENSIDIIDINSPKFYWLALYASKILGIKTILTRNVPYRKKGLKKILNGFFLYKKSDAVISLSEKIKSELQADYGIKNVYVIYDGINLPSDGIKENSGGYEDIRRKMRGEFGFSPENTLLGVIGRIEESKGQIFLVESVLKLKTQFPDLRLVIVGGTGDERYKTRIENFIGANNLKDIVRIAGFRDDITEIYRTIDILVHPSLYDNIPFSILEAMSYGLPVVASAVGGIPEAVCDGLSGYLVKPADSDDLTEKISKLLRSDYKKMGEEGKKIAAEKFKKEICFENYKNLINRILR